MDSIIKKLSVENNNKRFELLCQILDIKNIGYQITEVIRDEILIRNIIIRFGSSLPRLVIGAHHDSVKESTGANDNMSGVVILINLAEELMKTPLVYPIDIVFFDHEETGALGSRAYVEEHNQDICAMINLDICGVGDSIIVGPKSNVKQGILGNAFSKMDCSKHNFHLLKSLPPGDDRIFEDAGIPNISIGIVESSDVKPMSTLFDDGKNVPKEDFPSIIETMHNGPRDNVEIIDITAMKKVLSFTQDIIRGIII